MHAAVFVEQEHGDGGVLEDGRERRLAGLDRPLGRSVLSDGLIGSLAEFDV